MREPFHIRILCLFGLVAGILNLAGCGPGAPGRARGVSPRTTSTDEGVPLVHPQRKALRRTIEQPGTIRAYEETQLFARVPGYVRIPRNQQGRLLSDIGRKVRGPRFDNTGKEVAPGDVLAELLVPELKEEMHQKQALVAVAEATVEQAFKTLAAAAAGVEVADAAVIEAKAFHDRWESEAKRMEELAKSGVVVGQTREETLKQYRAGQGRLASAKAAVQKAKADQGKADADVRAARAHVSVARAEARRSEAMYSYATIRAPFDGVITRRKASNGDFVQPAGGHGDWLFTIACVDPLRVVIAVPEEDAPLVHDGANVTLTVQALVGPPPTGTIARTSWDLEHTSRTLRAEIDLPVKGRDLRPGMYVYGKIEAVLPEAWILPATALVKQGDNMVCFRIEGGKAIRTPVQVGRGDGQFVQVHTFQKIGPPATWQEWTGNEKVAQLGAGLADGQEVHVAAGN
jgi:multidrug efflux pump subunit AcrA (membrane-fusion protein)